MNLPWGVMRAVDDQGVSWTGILFYVRPVSGGWKPGGIVEPMALVVLLLVWMAASWGTGGLLALLAKRLHPGLNMIRLWLFYSVLMATLVAVVFLIAWF